jgi:hypothetical protein
MPRLVLLAALLVVACLAHDDPPAPAADLTEPGTTPEPLATIKIPDMYKNGQFVVVGKPALNTPPPPENTEIDPLDPTSNNHDDWPEGLEPASSPP